MVWSGTYLDVLLLTIVMLSAVVAAYRGFSREFFATVIFWPIGIAASFFVVLSQPILAGRVAYWRGISFREAEFSVGAAFFLLVIAVVHSSLLLFGASDSRKSIDRILGFAFGVVRGFVLVVIPYMFYDSFVPDPRQQAPWVRDAVSLPYIKSTGDSFRVMLVRLVPPQLMGPGEQQQGQLFQPSHPSLVAPRGQSARLVLYPVRPTDDDS